MRRSVLLVSLVLAVPTALLAPAAAHADACSSVTTTGSAVPNQTWLTQCVVSGPPLSCSRTEAGVDPEVNVIVDDCIPWF